MKALVVRGTRDYGFEEIQLDSPGPREVRVAIRAASVCRFDLSILDGRIPAPFPLVLGHEGAGIVEEVGGKVTRVRPGDHVVFALQGSCGYCESCARGAFSDCRTYPPEFILSAALPGDTLRHRRADGTLIHTHAGLGCLAEATVAHEDLVVRVDSDVPFERACIAGCSVVRGAGAAMLGGYINPGDNVAVLSCGAVGLSAIQGARLAGAGGIVAVDRAADRRALAERLGAACTIDPARESVSERIHGITRGGADVALECAGAAALILHGYASLCNGGKLVLVGIPGIETPLDVPAFSLPFSSRSIRGAKYGSHRPQRDVPALLQQYRAGALDLDSLVTETLPLDQVFAVLEELRMSSRLRTVFRLG